MLFPSEAACVRETPDTGIFCGYKNQAPFSREGPGFYGRASQLRRNRADLLTGLDAARQPWSGTDRTSGGQSGRAMCQLP